MDFSGPQIQVDAAKDGHSILGVVYGQMQILDDKRTAH
jgi:hypothetical protein